MDIELCFKAISQFADLCKKLTFQTGINFQPKFIISGGDPLLHPGVFSIIKEIGRCQYAMEMLGNADRLTNNIAAKLSDFGVKRFQISLDGTEKTHDKIRGAGSFKTSIKGIHTLLYAGIKTAVMSSVFKDNINDLCDLIKIAAKEGVDSFAFSRVASFGNARELNSLISPREYRDLLEMVYELQSSLAKNGCKTCFPRKDHLWTLFLHEKGEYKIYPHYKKGRTVDGCHMGQSFMVLLSDGTVMACRRFYSPIGKFPEQNLADIFLKSKECAKYRSIKRLEKCSGCELLYYCRGCPAVADGLHNNWQKADPQCWKDVG